RMEKHYDHLRQAVEADPEIIELLQQRKMTQNDFSDLYDNMLPYKDRASSVLKKVLRDENLLNDFRKNPDDLERSHLLNNVFADVKHDQLTQPNAQPNQQANPQQ